MIKEQIQRILDNCFIEGVKQELWSNGAASSYSVELPKHSSHGDYSTNMAMIIAGREKKNPRELAAQL
jgi:arginyl-tRNA synthetase